MEINWLNAHDVFLRTARRVVKIMFSKFGNMQKKRFQL